MMPVNPLLLYGGATAAGGLINALAGRDDEFQMSPEAKDLYRILLGKYNRRDFGLSPLGRQNLLSNLKSNLTEESQAQTGNVLSSIGRRGAGPGELAGASTDIASAYGKAYGRGATNIDIANEQFKRQDEAGTLNALTGLTGQQVYKPGGGFDFGDIAENLTLFSQLNQKRKKPTLMDLFYLGGQ